MSYLDADTKTKTKKTRRFSKDAVVAIAGAVAIAIVVLIVLVANSLCPIGTGEVGIKTRFGKVIDQELPEGMNFKIPFVEKIEKMNVRVQKYTAQSSGASKDLQNVAIDVALNYQVQSDKARELYKRVGNGYEDVVLSPALSEVVKGVVSNYTAEDLIANRAKFSEESLAGIRTRLEAYGISTIDINITDIDFSEEFDKAIEEKQVAEQKALTAQKELEREKVEAEKKVVKAEADRKANELKQQTLTDNIIKEKFVEKWDGKMPQVMGGQALVKLAE